MTRPVRWDAANDQVLFCVGDSVVGKLDGAWLRAPQTMAGLASVLSTSFETMAEERTKQIRAALIDNGYDEDTVDGLMQVIELGAAL